MIEQNRGNIKAANVLQKYHNSRLERMNTLERDNALEIKTKKSIEENQKTEIKDVKLSESHKSHLANFRFAKRFVDLLFNIHLDLRRWQLLQREVLEFEGFYMKQKSCQNLCLKQ